MFTTPAIAALRRRFPDAQLSYLVERPAEPVVRHNPHLTNIIIVERPRGLKRVVYDWRLARRLRAERFDVVIDFHGGPRSAWLTWATRAPRRIGYALPGRPFAYTTRVPWTRSLVPPRHSVENQWDLLTPLGVEPPARTTRVEMPIDTDAARTVAERLAAAGVAAAAPLIVMHVSAGNPFRRWPAEHFATVAATLAREDPSRRIVISSGPSEREAADAVAADAQRAAGAGAAAAILRCGDFDLSELRALVGRAALYIGGDSGPLHIAATTETPIVALFGPTLPERSLPWRVGPPSSIAVDAGPLVCRPCHQRECVTGDFRCLTAIQPDRVIAAARTLLATGTGETTPPPPPPGTEPQ